MEIQVINHRGFFAEFIKPKLKFFRNFNSFFYYVLILILCGFLFFGFALFTQYFTTPYTGDYSQQGIPFAYNFYDTWWTTFKSFSFPNWDSNIFLGADTIEANTFYGIFSPFTFLLLIFPRQAVPQVLAITSLLRLIIGGLLFRIYLKSLGVKEGTARMFSIAYAFVGWTVFYLWFNSFYEVATFFPLILYGIEKVLKDKSIWQVALGFFLLGISNYFFLLTAGIFGVFYAGFRYFQTFKTRNKKDNLIVVGLGILGFALGILMSGFCTIPAVISSFSIARYQDSTYLSDIMEAFDEGRLGDALNYIFFYWGGESYGYRVFYPIVSFLYPTISDRFVTVLRDQYYDNFGSSLFIYTPSIILLFSSMYISVKEKKVSHFVAIGVLALSLFIPFFYYLSGAFSIGYGRFQIVITLAMLAYIAIQFDKRKMVPRWFILISGIITAILMICSYLYALKIEELYTRLQSYSEILYLVIYELVITAVTTILLTSFWKSIHLKKVITGILMVEITVMGTVVANVHGLNSYITRVNGGYQNVPTEVEIISNITAEDDSFYRIQSTRAYSSNDNLPLVENYNGVSAFHSFYNTNVDDFMRMSHIFKSDSTWIGSSVEKRINLDTFLGVKYYIYKDSDFVYSYSSNGTRQSVTLPGNIPLGYSLTNYGSDSGYQVYENEHYINFGFSYDTIYYKNNSEDSIYNDFHTSSNHLISTIRNEESYYKGAILDNEDVEEIIEEYGDIFSYENAPTMEMSSARSTRYFYYYPYDFDPTNPDDYLVRGENDNPTSSSIVEDYDASDILIILEPSNSDFYEMGENGMYFLLYYRIASDYAADIFLIGEDEDGNSEVILFDAYQNADGNGVKYLRAFYPTQPVKRIIISPRSTELSVSPTLYLEDINTTFSRIDNAREYQLTNVYQGIDYYSFDSDYDTQRFVVTQIAYHDGWSITATDALGRKYELKTYNTEGGFVGFVTPTTGLIHYEMTYSTPYIKIGVIAFVTSFVVLTGTSVAIYVLKRRKKLN